MKIRFLRSWRRFRTGDEWAPTDPYANVLIRRNIAKEVKRGRPRKNGDNKK